MTMRIATLGLLAFLASATHVTAADLDYGYLRGADDGYAPVPEIDWSGVYVGGHGGYSSAAHGFPSRYGRLSSAYFTVINRADPYSATVNSATSNMLSSSNRGEGESFGGYIGYNLQMDEVVFGLEADYTSFNRSGRSRSFAYGSFFDNGSQVDIAVTGISTTKITDYGTMRGRLGYAFGAFLPYVTGGVAVGRAKIADQVEVASNISSYDLNLSETNFRGLNSSGVPSYYSKTKVVGGVALGAGLEYAITPNILLRGEYQYILFDDFDGHKANINTVRGGAAVKF